MSAPPVGMIAGLLVAIATATGGSSAFALAVFLGAVGFFVGAQISGTVDLIGMVTNRGRG